ncbi:MAG: Nif3-like dinuclear metal center hexameric protein [Planctomycetaceae bacterium]|nr:Nif3-like dinuclear metal center hexameric protein [Planctomycetaceae bacterium]
MTVEDVVNWLDQSFPPVLAEEWDNTGLLLGSSARPVESILTCLTLTSDVAAEAVQLGAGLVVTHHPLMFRPLQRITSCTSEGRLLLQLLEAGVAVYSPHTAFDSAACGINQQLAEMFGLLEIAPLRPAIGAAAEAAVTAAGTSGSGRQGLLPEPCCLAELVEQVKRLLPCGVVQWVGDGTLPVSRLAVACGSAAEYLTDAERNGCQVLLTGEARFHAALAARDAEMGLILAGHYATERPAVEQLAAMIGTAFPALRVQPSQQETDPLKWS